MPEDEEKVDLEALASRMGQLEQAMDRLSQPYAQLVGYLDRLQEISRSYFRLLDLLQRYGSLSPEMAIPEIKDPISRDIVRVLFEKGGRNISQIAAGLRARRGTASRRIVRERLMLLEEKGVVVSSRESRGRVYDVSDETVRRWSQVLGLIAPGSEGEEEGKSH
ncbi:MAG: winged helix-turn-helix domain-containing protein [Candidatus Thermoplasmatota archaeon]|nr:winged helix-turn-helix domain-containing protein [Candidatus Thermoplasmatota archaeon]